jgi:exosortase
MTTGVAQVEGGPQRGVAGPLALAGGLLALVLWSYWPTLAELYEYWQNNQDYSVGQLVPLVALYLLWSKRNELRVADVRASAAGWLLLAASQAARFMGLYWAYASGERLSFILAISGVVLLLGGWTIFRRTIWIQAFLLLMMPLPTRVHYAIALPLQNWATSLGHFGLELLGYYVVREGNVLTVNETSQVMVAEACSGLRMLTAFVFTAAVLCFLIRRPAWKRVVLLLSSVPVAVISNGLRVLGTSLFVHYSESEALEKSVHDLAGLLMMPLAVLLLVAELKLLDAIAEEKPVRRTSKGAKPAQRRGLPGQPIGGGA